MSKDKAELARQYQRQYDNTLTQMKKLQEEGRELLRREEEARQAEQQTRQQLQQAMRDKEQLQEELQQRTSMQQEEKGVGRVLWRTG